MTAFFEPSSLPHCHNSTTYDKTTAGCGRYTAFCQALADTTRIAILYELAEGRKNVSELVEALSSPQGTVSRHLKGLRERQMVNTERDGVNVYYSLADPRIIGALNLLREVMADILTRRGRLAEALAS